MSHVADIDALTPPEVTSELVLELIATVCADLAALSEKAASEETRADLSRAYNMVRDLRWAFDPHDPQSAESILRRVSRYAEVLRAGGLIELI